MFINHFWVLDTLVSYIHRESLFTPKIFFVGGRERKKCIIFPIKKIQIKRMWWCKSSFGLNKNREREREKKHSLIIIYFHIMEGTTIGYLFLVEFLVLLVRFSIWIDIWAAAATATAVAAAEQKKIQQLATTARQRKSRCSLINLLFRFFSIRFSIWQYFVLDSCSLLHFHSTVFFSIWFILFTFFSINSTFAYFIIIQIILVSDSVCNKYCFCCWWWWLLYSVCVCMCVFATTLATIDQTKRTRPSSSMVYHTHNQPKLKKFNTDSQWMYVFHWNILNLIHTHGFD